MKRLALATLALVISMTVTAVDAPKFDPAHLSADIKTLSSDAFEGRGPATPGETKTIDFLIAQYQAAGMQPGGELKNGKRGWTQAVPLLRTQMVGAPALSVSVNGTTQAWTQGEQIAVRSALDGSKSVDIDNAPLVFVGYGVKAPERHWDDFKGVDLHGKIAVVLINDPDYETGVGDFGGKTMTYYGRWTYKYEEAARQGAAGVLIVHETGPAAYGWATVKNSNINAMFDILRSKPSAMHPQVEAWIQRDVAVDLFKRAGLDFEALKKQAQTREFQPVVLKGESFSANYKVDSKVITTYNVVARLPGSKRPDETVIYSAHWDHLGVGAPDASGDRIYHGALDNGSGTAALLELARAFAKAPRPERSVVMLSLTAEEKGLLGSEYYAANPLYPLSKTVADINMDIFDPYGPARNFSISGSAKLDLLDDLINTAKQWNVSYSADPKPEAGHFFRSDHFSFAKRGVPAISFQSGDDWVDGGLAAGKAYQDEYVAKHYHQPADKWQADWTFTGMTRDLQILYTLGYQLANSDQWPDWSKDSEFRAARDASAAERK